MGKQRLANDDGNERALTRLLMKVLRGSAPTIQQEERMSFKMLISPIALAAAVTLSTGALAQTMVGDQAVTDEDLPAVSDHCQMLAAEGEDAAGADAATDDAATDGDAAEGDAAADDTNANGDAAGDETAADGMATDPEIAAPGDTMAGDATIDFDAITLAECAEAGLI